jgi:hypothetical protein
MTMSLTPSVILGPFFLGWGRKEMQNKPHNLQVIQPTKNGMKIMQIQRFFCGEQPYAKGVPKNLTTTVV